MTIPILSISHSRYREGEGVDPIYVKKMDVLQEEERTTLYIDFRHIGQYDQELAEAIELEYYRYDLDIIRE